MSEDPKKPDDEGTTPAPVDPDEDPKRDADKPEYPAPSGPGMHHHPGGAGGPPPAGVNPTPGKT